jgi:hypothetical protein
MLPMCGWLRAGLQERRSGFSACSDDGRKGAPMPDLVIRLEREEAEELLHWTKGKEGVPECDPDDQGICVCCNARRKLRAALDSPPVEETELFQVVGPGGRQIVPVVASQEELERTDPAGLREMPGSRTQRRTQTVLADGSTLYSPWTDLPGEGGEDGG